MSYIRYGHNLQWFNDKSTEYVYGCGEGQIEDYNSDYIHLPSLVELIGHMVLWQTNDFDYATKIVVKLAYKLGIKNKLRTSSPHEHDGVEIMTRGRDYRKSVREWMQYFNEFDPARGVFCMRLDDLSDFDELDTFKEEELYDVEEHFGKLLDEIKTAVEDVIKSIDLPCPINVESGVYRWCSVCNDADYDLEATVSFIEAWTSESWKEEREIENVETRIKQSGVLDVIGKRIGVKIGITCYMPFTDVKV